MKLQIDSERTGEEFKTTGIYVRGLNTDGNWGNLDINQLDKNSLLEFLRSRGGKNEWAENVVAILLGHGQFTL